MSQYANLKAAIAANVYENHNNQVTANMVKAAMNAMVDSLGAGYQYLGIATPTNPGTAQTPDQKVFYIATTPGTYTYLGGLVVNDGEVAILKWDTAWHKEVTGAVSKSELNKIESQSYLNIFLTDRPIYLEHNSGNGIVYFKFNGTLFVRFGAISRNLSMSDMAQEIGLSLVTSPKGIADCIGVPNSNSLCYNVTDNTFYVIVRSNVRYYHKVLLENQSGHICYVSQGLINVYDNKMVIDSISSELKYFTPKKFVGNGNTFSSVDVLGLVPNNRYRVYIQNPNWDISSVTVTGVYQFAVQSVVNGVSTPLATAGIGTTIAHYYDFVAPSAFDKITIGGRANSGVDVVFDVVDITALKQKVDLVPYFAASSVPQFLDVDLTTPTLKVKFPLNPLRLYTSFGESLIGDYSGAVNQTFTLANLQSLVWDFKDNSVKVVNTNNAGDYIHLLNLAKNSVTGLFAGWFNEQKWIDFAPDVSLYKAANTLGEEVTASKSYTITPGMAGFSGLVEVGVPYNRKFIFRVNDPSGTLTKVSDLAGYDYDGNSVSIAAINLLPNTDYVYYAPVGLKSLRVWVGSSFMTGTAGTITVQVTIPSQYDDESIVRRWNDSDKLVVRDNLLKDADFKALFFSDIHGYTAELLRIIALGNDWKSLLDCIIDTGDDTASYQSASPLTWYNDLAPTSELPIVRAVGNHDAWTTGYNVWGTAEQVYNFFTKPAVELLQSKGASVVQPADAATAFRNYYYVDFGAIRMIVILSLTGGGFYDASQNSWFESVLADAITNDKSVVCINHAPMPISSSVANIESNWCSYKTRVSDGTIMEDAPLTAVDSFIRAGGKFVCWFTGHTHIDYVMKFSKTIDGVTKTQFCFTTSTASQAGPIDAVRQKSNRDNGFDLFNMVGIDLTNHLVKIWRIGLNTNQYLQLHNTFVWDYVNNRIVSD